MAYQTKSQGPEAKYLSIGRIIWNDVAGQRVTLNPFKGIWKQLRVCHYPLYLAEGGTLTTEAKDKKAEATVLYAALVLEVELLSGGELVHGAARTLSDRGWGLKMEICDEIAFFRTASEVSTAIDAEARAAVALRQPAQGKPVQSTPIPKGVATNLGAGHEALMVASEGRRVQLRQSAVHDILRGARVALLEVFCGCMELTLGARKLGLYAPDGVDATFPVGDKPWDLSNPADQNAVGH